MKDHVAWTRGLQIMDNSSALSPGLVWSDARPDDVERMYRTLFAYDDQFTPNPPGTSKIEKVCKMGHFGICRACPLFAPVTTLVKNFHIWLVEQKLRRQDMPLLFIFAIGVTTLPALVCDDIGKGECQWVARLTQEEHNTLYLLELVDNMGATIVRFSSSQVFFLELLTRAGVEPDSSDLVDLKCHYITVPDARRFSVEASGWNGITPNYLFFFRKNTDIINYYTVCMKEC